MPQRSFDSPQRERDLLACRQLLRGGSRTFYAASFLLPRAVREPASALYAFCRIADDAVDLDVRRPDVLARLRQRLALAYEGKPLPHSADRAFADVVARFDVPRALPEALLEGFEWDLERRRYADLSALHGYAARVAGTVGAMMSVLMGARSPDLLARACDLGVAMQLTNIARDVGEDARAGRLYLPLDWLHQAGIDADAFLRAPAYCPRIASVVERLLRAADALYARAEAGISRLPLACQPGIRAACRVYAEIGREVERRQLDSVSQRAVVPGRRKAQLILHAALDTARPRSAVHAPPLPETRFLVDAAAADMPARPARVPLRWGETAERFDRRVEWMVNLFDRLEREQREAHRQRSVRPAARATA
jgi:phytoene synthase